MKLNSLRYLVIITLFMVTSCRLPRESTAAYLNYETSFVRSEPNGMIVVRSFGSGLDKSECRENAIYNALRTAIFKGINGYADQHPILTGSNPEDRHAAYFRGFFNSDGPYKSFVDFDRNGNVDRNDKFTSNRRVSSGSGGIRKRDRLNMAFEISIKYDELRQQLRKLYN